MGRAPSNRLDDFAGTERASFCRVRWDVLQHGIQLGEDEARCQRFHRVHAAGILYGQQGQDTHAVYVPLVKGLQVGLNAGTARRIRPGDSQGNRRHAVGSNMAEKKFSSHRMAYS